MFEKNESVDPSNRIVEWKDGRTPRPDSICTARKSNGDPCRKQRVTGAVVCTTHGGRAPQVKEKARIRLEMAAEKLAKELLRIAIDDETPPAVKLAALRDALDRTGLSARHALSVEVGPNKAYESLLTEMIEGGSRAESRAARGVPEGGTPEWLADELDVLDAELVGDDEAEDYRPAPAPTSRPREEAAPSPETTPSGLMDYQTALDQLRVSAPPPVPQGRRRRVKGL